MMAARGTGLRPAPPAIPDMPHVPVLLAEVLDQLAPRPGEVFVDGTFGAGGYTVALLEAGARVVAIDRDPNAIADGQALAKRHKRDLTLVQDRFSHLDAVAREAGHEGVDGVVLDIGVSSMQLDQAARGFSFRREGPLDMRMEQDGLTALDLVTAMPGRDLARVIGLLGEERRASRVAGAIVAARGAEPLDTTLALSRVIEKAIGAPRPDEIHPATRTFQALRIYVNDELGELARALFAAERILKPGGRLVVVSFHSLEDRIVKTFLAERSKKRAGGSRHMPEPTIAPPTFELISRGPVTASDAETGANPRARSAKLRSGLRTEAPARDGDPAAFGVPNVPEFRRARS